MDSLKNSKEMSWGTSRTMS